MTDALETILPHRAPMRWLDALIACDNTTATATACFRAGDFAVANGIVLETALVECIAQTVAAAQGWRAQSREAEAAPITGMLVAVTNFRVTASPPVGKILTITISERKRFGPMLMISGEISCDENIIAAGDLTLYA